MKKRFTEEQIIAVLKEHVSGAKISAIAIARAALFNPKVLLLDKPTAALAAREVQHVLNPNTSTTATGAHRYSCKPSPK